MTNMKKLLGSAVVSAGLLASTSSPVMAYQHYESNSHYVRHKRHMKTLKRVGIGAGGGAVVGGLIGGGAGAGIGALAGGGAGYLYDRHKKHHGHY
jgi:uncharacterized protein YcfJ